MPSSSPSRASFNLRVLGDGRRQVGYRDGKGLGACPLPCLLTCLLTPPLISMFEMYNMEGTFPHSAQQTPHSLTTAPAIPCTMSSNHNTKHGTSLATATQHMV